MSDHEKLNQQVLNKFDYWFIRYASGHYTNTYIIIMYMRTVLVSVIMLLVHVQCPIK